MRFPSLSAKGRKISTRYIRGSPYRYGTGRLRSGPRARAVFGVFRLQSSGGASHQTTLQPSAFNYDYRRPRRRWFD